MRSITSILIFFLLLSGCTVILNETGSTRKFAALYNPSEYSLNIDYQIYHISDDITSLYIKLFPKELLFNQANNEGKFRAVVQISYAVFELDDTGEILSKVDSSRFTVVLGQKDKDRSAYFTSKVMQIPKGKKYLVRFDSKDLQRGTIGLKHMYIDKINEWSSQNFSVISPRTGYPKFLNYFVVGEVFRLNYRLPGHDTVYLDFFKSDNQFPRPPVTLDTPVQFPVEPDTTIAIQYADSMLFTLPEEGMYHFRMDLSRKEGLTIHNFGSDYPKVKTEKGLMEPLFYIATLTEYKKMQQQENLKRAIDDFWLLRSTSMERSRELIRVYYNRVLYSNLYFTADREGWKTDRGMMFILFGPPDRMKDSGKEQRWYYISRRQGRIIEFVFERKASLYSNQDLVWKKNIQSMQYWSAAVSSWRSGKVYSLGK